MAEGSSESVPRPVEPASLASSSSPPSTASSEPASLASSPSSPTVPCQKPRPSTSRALVVAFAAGLLFVTPGLLLLFVPSFRSWADEARQRLIWGCLAQDGVRLVLERGAGSKLVLIFRNEGETPRELVCPGGDEGAAEFDVLVEDSSGQAIAPRELDPREDTIATEPRLMALPPRTQATLALDVGHYVTLPGPGRYRITVERARLRLEEPRLRSNTLVVDWP